VKRLFTVLLLALGWIVSAGEVIPPVPAQYFNDYAGVISSGTRQHLNQVLEDFERQTSSQVVVAIYPKMQTDSSIEDYTVRVAQAWRVGQKVKNNGAVLFVFINDRKMYVQVGYGLEGALPDALCKRIVEDEIRPEFKAGNYDAGLSAGVAAILAATKGEYHGTGRTAAEGRGRSKFPPLFILIPVAWIFVVILSRRLRGGSYYTSSGWDSSGGGWSIGGGGGGGGGGFSGGGGSFGGGGAGGSW
jgi:uncharacterized protein